MKFYKYIYYDETFSDRKKQTVRWRLKVGKWMKPVYLVTLHKGPDQLDIMSSLLLKQSHYVAEDLFVIGIASTYDGAVSIVKTIAEECYAKNGNGDLLQYLAEKEF